MILYLQKKKSANFLESQPKIFIANNNALNGTVEYLMNIRHFVELFVYSWKLYYVNPK